jgi:hypothetical protein
MHALLVRQLNHVYAKGPFMVFIACSVLAFEIARYFVHVHTLLMRTSYWNAWQNAVLNFRADCVHA